MDEAAQIEKTWEIIHEIRGDDVDALTVYAQYHLLVNHDYDTWKLLHKKYAANRKSVEPRSA